MVQNIPDPPKEESAVSDNGNIPAIGGTDSEDENESEYDGYTMLPTDANDAEEPSEDEESAEASAAPEVPPVEPSTFEKAAADEVRAVWSAPHEARKEAMNPELTEEVLKAMKGFSLPASAIPPWAKDVGEDDWKNHLLEKIRSGK